MKKILFQILIFIVLFSISCKKDDLNKDSPYPQLSGTYEYSYYNSWQGGLYENSSYASWEFDNTNKAYNYTCGWSYTQTGWVNATKEGYGSDMEWKVEGGKLWARLWESTGNWTTYTFEFINAKTIKLDGNTYVRK